MEEIDEDQFWDELEIFCSSIHIQSSSPQLEECCEQQQQGIHTSLDESSIPTLASQQDIKAVEQDSEINVFCLNLELSRGCPIRHLARIELRRSSHVMLTSKHEVEHQGEQVLFTHPPEEDNIQTWLNFIILKLWEAFQQLVGCLSFFFSWLVVHKHEEHQKLVRKGNYFDKPVNGFV